MDASDITRKKQARFLAAIKVSPSNAIQFGQVPNNPPLTPGQNSIISSQYPKSDFANTNAIYPCGSNLCSTIYTSKYYYNSTN
jgi:hypothetical protein